ncbi:phosphatidylinositol-3-phosphatase SAC1 Ecym_3618 [Eremothecium cymbalariae DBVPG|uniref:SAC domain-containing protein n=1 Tax=Eremothecium cymbalariae (strain CBS 270.75 / DBVPG 7215 / KCTC 17166 / NRRL Y-17582) TaxID=931890 RepID=G8JQU5_ERECY|nr:Hypothetical protein Ecym_3618 [Eremothecium cymbalariae DBVPG\
MRGPLLHVRVNDRLLFKQSSLSGSKIVLSVSPYERGITVVDPDMFPNRYDYRKIAALIGIIRMKNNRYVITANRVEDAGVLNGHKFFKVVEHSVIPVKKDAKMHSEESQYVALLEAHLSKAALYFSYTYDLTNSIQRNEQHGAASWRTAESRFFWNYYISESLRELSGDHPSVDDFIVPMIYGFVKVVDTVFKDIPIKLALLTRRSRFRAGTRYFRRGIDQNGNVANFNETEQILLVQNSKSQQIHLFSFLQTRGSVPVYWSEVNALKYKPNLLIGANGSLGAFKEHFKEQKQYYGKNYVVNLVNQKGYELPVKETFESTVDAADDTGISYVYFDFHAECSKMRWHRVKLLIEQLQGVGWDSNDFFHKTLCHDGTTDVVLSLQKSIVRTNCMDCVDRTNVAQSVLANWVLQKQLEASMAVTVNVPWEIDPNLLSNYQNIWADNADAISCAYSGTGALKTDFTRTGKRTYTGAMKDFANSAFRYYRNNFTDGPRQDSYDIFLGNFRPYETAVQSPFIDRRPFVIQLMPTILYAALTVIIATIMFPKGYFFSLKNLTFFAGSSLIALLTIRFIVQHGMQYVNWPKLCDLGYVEIVYNHNKEQVFKGITYTPSSDFVKPNFLKRD